MGGIEDGPHGDFSTGERRVIKERKKGVPNRILRDGINSSRAVNSLSEGANLFFRSLMSVVDDYGRYYADPALIRAECFPLRLEYWPEDRILAYLDETTKAFTEEGVALVTVYVIGRRRYLQINNFNQRIRSASKFPEPPSPITEPPRIHVMPPCVESPAGGRLSAPEQTPVGTAPSSAGLAGARARSEAEAEAYCEGGVGGGGGGVVQLPPPPPPPSVPVVPDRKQPQPEKSSWPVTSMAIRSRFPTTDDGKIAEIVSAALAAYPEATDNDIGDAVNHASKSSQKSASLYLKTVPEVLRTWLMGSERVSSAG